MAFRSSSVAYIINEEEDGFVAVDFDIIDVDENQQQDLSSWELIDQSDEEEEGCLFDEKIDGVCEENDGDLTFMGSLPSDISSEYLADGMTGEDVNLMMESPPSDVSSEYLAERTICHHQFAAVDGDVMKDDLDGEDDYEEEDNDDDDDEEEEEEDYDLDDELIPFCVNNKFGRQRMRKLGKRACPKLMKSKRLTYNYSRPGCVHGKHGLGLKA